MGEIFIEGLGVVEIEGDTPNEQEQQAILGAISDPEDDGDPFVAAGGPVDIPKPEIPKGIGLRVSSGESRAPKEGPLGVVPPERREVVREKVEKKSGLMQLITEISPSAVGTGLGATAGFAFGGPAGALGGGMLGGMAGEAFAQESGLAPSSDLNMALAGAGPLAGPVIGKGLQLARRGIGTGFVKGFPPARAARARNIVGGAIEEFESLGTRILGKQKGLVARASSELFEAAKRSGVRVKTTQTRNSQNAIAELVRELGPVASLPEVRQSIRALNQISETILNNPKGVLLDDLVKTRSFVGDIIGRLHSKGGIKVGSAKQVFAAISKDLDELAKSPFRKGRQTRLAQAAIKRAKLEFSVKDLEAQVAQFTSKSTDVPGGVSINFKGLDKWITNVTNPKHAKYDKNFATALADDLPVLKERISKLAELTVKGGIAGGGSIVVRGQSAKIGRGVVGGALGFLGTGGTATGAAIGGVAFAQLPEMIVAMLTTKPGAAFLEGAAKFGQGHINSRAWATAMEITMRTLGEKGTPKKKSEEGKGVPLLGHAASSARRTSKTKVKKSKDVVDTDQPVEESKPRVRPRLPKIQ